MNFTTERSPDPYSVLGLERNATQSQIKKAYFDLAKKYHPDTTGNSNGTTDPETTKKFHQIQAAYELLENPQKRAQFDQSGSDSDGCPFDSSGFFSYSTHTHTQSDPFSNIFGDIFSQFTSQRSTSTANNSMDWDQSDLDVTVPLSLTFQQAVLGVNGMKVEYMRSEPCKCCSGNGIKPGSSKTTCLGCKGTGQFRRRMQGLFFSQTCPECRGSGYQFTSCPECHGKGLQEERSTATITIPPGVQPNDVIQRAGLGHWIGGYPRGNLNIRITNISASEGGKFERRKNDIHSTVKIPLHQAILGGTVRVSTIWGDVEMLLDNTADGTTTSTSTSLPLQPNSVKRLRGKGIHNGIDGTIGDHLVHLQITLPTQLTEKQKQLLNEFAQQLANKEEGK